MLIEEEICGLDVSEVPAGNGYAKVTQRSLDTRTLVAGDKGRIVRFEKMISQSIFHSAL